MDSVVFPHLSSCSQSLDYRMRLVSVDMCCTMLSRQREGRLYKRDSGSCLLKALRSLITLSNDDVPNVRLNVCRALSSSRYCEVLSDAVRHNERQQFHGKGKAANREIGEVREEIKRKVREMGKDQDGDVRYYARMVVV